jgi:DNA-binding GntR family transcriptional regulator
LYNDLEDDEMSGGHAIMPVTGDESSQVRGLLSDHIRRTLAEEIATGRLKPGTYLDEQHLADRFGASRTPVREALRQLSTGGMVEVRPRRGVIVAPLTPERIMDMFETAAEIEAMCVRLATYRISPIERGQLLAMQEHAPDLVQAGDVDGYDTHNRRFHEMIYKATHNQFMAEQALAIHDRLAAFVRAQYRQSSRIARSNAEHGEILQAMARGDGDEAARCMRAHYLNASVALERYLAETLA